MDSLFAQLGLLTIVAAMLAGLARMLRQPIVLAYLTAGVVLGAGGFHVIPNNAVTHDIALVGIIFLLFLVGLELDVKKVRKLGGVILATGLLQMAITALAAFGFTRLLGYPVNVAVYLGLAAAFSSTAVVMKLLADRHDLASLYGRVTIGILLLQDVVAIGALIVVTGLDHGAFTPTLAASFLVRGAGLLVGTWLVTRYVLGPLFYLIAKSAELLFLASIAWAFLFAIISGQLGFSQEIGAFLAGLSLATLPYNLEIMGRVKPLKDFFLVIFFVVLGLEISWSTVTANLGLIVGLAVLVLFVKSMVASVVMIRMGYPRRPSYLTGAALGQMSEFSLLVVLLAATYGQVPSDTVAIVAALLIVSIAFNTYWNSINRFLYPILSKPLGLIAVVRHRPELQHGTTKRRNHTLLFGANRLGYRMLEKLRGMGKDVLVVDHNPEVVKRLSGRGIDCVYGDVEDSELLNELELDSAEMVISTIPHAVAAVYLVEATRKCNRGALIITTAEQIEDALALYAAGADYVIVPHLLGGEQAAQILEAAKSRRIGLAELRRHRKRHIGQLKRRRQELPVQ